MEEKEERIQALWDHCAFFLGILVEYWIGRVGWYHVLRRACGLLNMGEWGSTWYFT